jgi:tRNA (guanine37-N1)-methyltransferase
MSWDAHIITGFPSMFPGTLGESLAGRALHDGLWSLTTHDVRAHGQGKHKNIDDTPAGGGAGMVMRADVAASALDSVTARHSLPVLLPSPRGVRWTQSLAQARFSFAIAMRALTSALSKRARRWRSRWAIIFSRVENRLLW